MPERPRRPAAREAAPTSPTDAAFAELAHGRAELDRPPERERLAEMRTTFGADVAAPRGAEPARAEREIAGWRDATVDLRRFAADQAGRLAGRAPVEDAEGARAFFDRHVLTSYERHLAAADETRDLALVVRDRANDVVRALRGFAGAPPLDEATGRLRTSRIRLATYRATIGVPAMLKATLHRCLAALAAVDACPELLPELARRPVESTSVARAEPPLPPLPPLPPRHGVAGRTPGNEPATP